MKNIDLSEITLYAENQHVLARLVQWDELFGKGKGGMQFSPDVTIHAPDADIGRRDRTVILRVIACGPGNVSRGTLNECTLSEGDLVVANLLHKTHDLRLLGENPCTFNWETIMARIDIDEALKSINLVPLQAYIVCQQNEVAAQKLMMGKSSILSPFGDAQHSGGRESEPTFDQFGNTKRAAEKTKTVIEECISVGPGAVVDGLWQVPDPGLVGAMVLYDTSVAPIRFVAGGQSFTLVHTRHVIASFRSEPRVTDAGSPNVGQSATAN